MSVSFSLKGIDFNVMPGNSSDAALENGGSPCWYYSPVHHLFIGYPARSMMASAVSRTSLQEVGEMATAHFNATA